MTGRWSQNVILMLSLCSDESHKLEEFVMPQNKKLCIVYMKIIELILIKSKFVSLSILTLLLFESKDNVTLNYFLFFFLRFFVSNVLMLSFEFVNLVMKKMFELCDYCISLFLS